MHVHACRGEEGADWTIPAISRPQAERPHNIMDDLLPEAAMPVLLHKATQTCEQLQKAPAPQKPATKKPDVPPGFPVPHASKGAFPPTHPPARSQHDRHHLPCCHLRSVTHAMMQWCAHVMRAMPVVQNLCLAYGQKCLS